MTEKTYVIHPKAQLMVLALKGNEILHAVAQPLPVTLATGEFDEEGSALYVKATTQEELEQALIDIFSPTKVQTIPIHVVGTPKAEPEKAEPWTIVFVFADDTITIEGPSWAKATSKARRIIRQMKLSVRDFPEPHQDNDEHVLTYMVDTIFIKSDETDDDEEE